MLPASPRRRAWNWARFAAQFQAVVRPRERCGRGAESLAFVPLIG